ncbi:MAG: DUF362 domain-containing protein [Cyanobacteria bacterium P01_H01_bin.130]
MATPSVATPTAIALSSQDFPAQYTPPAAAHNANHILIKPNLGYPEPAPVTVSVGMLATVLQAVRAASPGAQITVLEGVCSKVSLTEIAEIHHIASVLDDGMTLVDADTVPLAKYENRFPDPVRFEAMTAPALLREVDCRISVSAFKRTQLKGQTLVSASLKNLYGLFPRSHYKARSAHSRGQLHRPSVPQILQDVYGCIGYLFDGGVVDGAIAYLSPDLKPNRKNAAIPCGWSAYGTDLLAVDRAICDAAQVDCPDYVTAIETKREAAIAQDPTLFSKTLA